MSDTVDKARAEKAEAERDRLAAENASLWTGFHHLTAADPREEDAVDRRTRAVLAVVKAAKVQYRAWSANDPIAQQEAMAGVEAALDTTTGEGASDE